MAFALGACTDDEPKYDPAPAVGELPVFFSLEDETEFELFENSTEIDVPVYRKSTAGELTIPVTATATPDAEGFDFPTTVTFADGEKEAHIIVPLNMDKVQGRVDYKVTFTIGDGVETPYYTDKVTYTLNYSPWDLVTGTDKNGNLVTKALFRDDLVAPMWGLDVVEYEVEMQCNPENNNIVRIVDPYGEAWPYAMYADYDDSEHHYMYFNITNPNAVFMCNENGVALGTNGSDKYFHTGLTLDEDGEILLTTYYNYYIANNGKPTADMLGTIAQGNLTYQTDKFLMSFVLDPKLTLYYANRNAKFRIIWPGAEEYVDPATVWNVVGIGQFTDGILYPLLTDEIDELPSYDVEIQQFGGDPAMYRIMNTWKAGVCPYGIDYTGDKYIEIDTTNPDCVILDLQATGLTFQSLGAFYIMNYAAYLIGNGYSAEDVIENGLNDTLKNGVVYSAPGNLLLGFPNAETGEISLSRGETEWQVILPEGMENAPAKRAAAVKGFNGDAPLQVNPRFKAAKPQWTVTAPVFSSMKKSLR